MGLLETVTALKTQNGMTKIKYFCRKTFMHIPRHG